MPGATKAVAGGGLPEWVEPELATLTGERFSDPAWIFERKLDGERCLAFAESSGVRLVDGEIVAFDGTQTRCERLQHRLGVAHPSDALLRDVPVYYYVFDVLHAEGRDVRSLPLLQRK
jgi:bifunctional non-homologous end joining protein LigD